MARFFMRKRTALGFTLVELLIVVAIIGVLSTIGVPTFKRMVQKSKKSEAKVNLGGLYTAEQAFFSEYGAYGNRVDKIGFEVDGSNLMYVVGFPDADCTSSDKAQPILGNPIGDNINQTYPAYYTPAVNGGGKGEGTVAGNVILGRCGNSGYALAGGATLPTIDVASTSGEADVFVASATGVIAPGVSKSNPANATDVDIWTMDNKRILSNRQDGVK